MRTRTRERLVELGSTDQNLQRAVADGRLQRVKHGYYADGSDWRNAYIEEKQRAMAIAATRAARTPPVVGYITAAAVHGLPLVGCVDERAHLVVGPQGSGTNSASVVRHRDLDDVESTVRHGVRVTSLARTVFDVARTQRLETALACADAAARRCARPGTNRVVDEAALADFTARLQALAEAHAGGRGVKQARRVSELMDPRADSPGESISRLYLVQLRVRLFAVQRPVRVASGRTYWVDFELPEAFGEFDGVVKYLDREMRAGRAPEQVLADEKQREDEIRAATGRRFIRWTTTQIRSVTDFESFLRGNGIALPARA